MSSMSSLSSALGWSTMFTFFGRPLPYSGGGWCSAGTSRFPVGLNGRLEGSGVQVTRHIFASRGFHLTVIVDVEELHRSCHACSLRFLIDPPFDSNDVTEFRWEVLSVVEFPLWIPMIKNASTDQWSILTDNCHEAWLFYPRTWLWSFRYAHQHQPADSMLARSPRQFRVLLPLRRATSLSLVFPHWRRVPEYGSFLVLPLELPSVPSLNEDRDPFEEYRLKLFYTSAFRCMSNFHFVEPEHMHW